MRLSALLAAVAVIVALIGAAALRRTGSSTMNGSSTGGKAERVKAIYDRAKARIAELKRRRRETAEGFARAAERAKADRLRKDLG